MGASARLLRPLNARVVRRVADGQVIGVVKPVTPDSPWGVHMDLAIARGACPGRQINSRGRIRSPCDPLDSRTKVSVGRYDDGDIEVPADRVRHEVNCQLDIDAFFLRSGSREVGRVSQRLPNYTRFCGFPCSALVHVRRVISRMTCRVGSAGVYTHLFQFPTKPGRRPTDQELT